MKRYSQIISLITSTPWAMEPKALKMMLEILESHLNGTVSSEQLRLKSEAFNDYGSGEKRVGNIGVLPLYGPIFPKADLMTEMSGATSMESFQQDFRKMMADPSVSAILMDIDSPGGSTALITEMMDEIRAARDVKPIYSVANTVAASAAYGIASAAGKMFATDSAQVGSVGTYLVHEDDSRKLENEGVDRTVIKAGRFKAMHLESLSDEAKGQLQDFVDDTNDRFIAGIAAGRRTSADDIRSNYGEGGVLTPSKAVQAGMIDGIGTFDAVVNYIANDIGGSPSVNSSVAFTNSTWYQFVPSSTTGVATTNTPVVWMPLSPGTQQSYDADMEHSEPGTGNPPQPATPPEEGDPAIENGWRRDPPPVAYETEERVVNREWLQQRADTLGVEYSDDTTDADLAEAVEGRINEVVVPLNNAAANAQARQAFAEQFPEQAERLARLEARDRAAEAHSFADGYSQFENQQRGFSPVVRQEIENAHLAIANRQFDHGMLSSLLDSVVNEYATVPTGETGSSRQRQSDNAAAPQNFREARQMFADAVQQAMTEDNLTQEAAIQHVSAQNPDLAKMYLHGHVG